MFTKVYFNYSKLCERLRFVSILAMASCQGQVKVFELGTKNFGASE